MDEQRNETVSKIEALENDLRVLGFELSLGGDHLFDREVATSLRDLASVALEMAARLDERAGV